MIVYAMQPYFFPYIGYYTPIKHSDVFVVFDIVQYRKQCWLNRNRIISLDKEFAYINIPVLKNKRDTLIKDTLITKNSDWEIILLNQLSVYAKRAPYYKQVIDLIKMCIDFKTPYLSEWNTKAINLTCDYLGISHNIKVISKVPVTLEPVSAPDEWGLNITIAMGGKTYLNLPGGIAFIDKDKFDSKGIELKFIKNNITPYDQLMNKFIPSLSIIDVMMFNSVKDTNRLIDDFVVL